MVQGHALQHQKNKKNVLVKPHTTFPTVCTGTLWENYKQNSVLKKIS